MKNKVNATTHATEKQDADSINLFRDFRGWYLEERLELEPIDQVVEAQIQSAALGKWLMHQLDKLDSGMELTAADERGENLPSFPGFDKAERLAHVMIETSLFGRPTVLGLAEYRLAIRAICVRNDDAVEREVEREDRAYRAEEARSSASFGESDPSSPLEDTVE